MARHSHTGDYGDFLRVQSFTKVATSLVVHGHATRLPMQGIEEKSVVDLAIEEELARLALRLPGCLEPGPS